MSLVREMTSKEKIKEAFDFLESVFVKDADLKDKEDYDDVMEQLESVIHNVEKLHSYFEY